MRRLIVCFLFLCPSGAAGLLAQSPQANRLARESSPYLLQHAHNPVDWYPWGEEAFERARRENKMVFLSVGYAACHWCHVMERESFVDPEIAKLLNQRFICVKVDREERPDVDQIYMLAVQLITGNGGWPMSIFLTPDSKPFWGGTYFPARDGDRGNATGFLSVLEQIDKAWKSSPEAVLAQGELVTEAIKKQQLAVATDQTKDIPTAVDVRRVAETIREQFDPENGGFGIEVLNPQQPKFPEASKLVYLLDQAQRVSLTDDEREQALEMLTQTLDAMTSGAMYDHLGGGFHRYSVDGRWQIPHFEKMLYDNGQLASIYAQAFELTDREEYRIVCEGICDFVIRELKASVKGDSDEFAFYSSLDADSEGEEGAFYRWKPEELSRYATEIDDYEILAEVYLLNAAPNFEAKYVVPHPDQSLARIAEKRELSLAELDAQLSGPRQAMLQIRESRERPATDTKILTAWNGLMIAGLADAGRILERDDYVAAAVSAADFLLREMPDERKRLRRSYALGEAKLDGYLDDYAMLVSGLIALHRTTSQSKWLENAQQLTDQQLDHYWDTQSGGFFFTADDSESLIVRFKDPLDNAVPSGTSIAAENLAYLASVTGQERYAKKLHDTLASVTPMFRRAPAAMPRMAIIAANALEAE